MLMMQGVCGGPWKKPGSADAHDAGGLAGATVKPSPADAHDAACLGGPW